MQTEPAANHVQSPFGGRPGDAALERTAAAPGATPVPLGLVPDLVRAIRTAAGFSQERLATELDVSISTVGSWERGERAPQLRNLQRLDVLYRGLIEGERRSA